VRQVSNEIKELVLKLASECEKDKWDLSLYIAEDHNSPPKRGYLESLYHFVSGLYHGYPICCILFFLRNKNSLVELNKFRGHDSCYVQCDRHANMHKLRAEVPS